MGKNLRVLAKLAILLILSGIISISGLELKAYSVTFQTNFPSAKNGDITKLQKTGWCYGGDYASGKRTIAINSVSRLDYHAVILSNVISSGLYCNIQFYLNGILIGTFQVLAKDSVKDLSWTFPPISGPTYELKILETNNLGIGKGSFQFSPNSYVILYGGTPGMEDVPDAEIDEGSVYKGSGAFTDPDPGAVSWTAVVNYGDGSGDQPLTLNPDKTYNLNHVYTDNGTFIVMIKIVNNNNVVISDKKIVAVKNIAPVVKAGAGAEIDEGNAFVSSGSFTDPGTDTWTATVDYGDGSGVKPLGLNPGKIFKLLHVYTDNSNYKVIITVTDDDNGSGAGTVTVIVNNVAPDVNAGTDTEMNEGSNFICSVSYTDPGADTWTAAVDYGDGSGIQTMELNPDKTFNLNHVYADNGTYTMSVSVTDDDKGIGTDIVTVIVNNVAPNVDAGSGAVINEGSAFAGSGSFADPGADTWTAAVDYGDGSEVQTLELKPDKTFNLYHIYPENGIYTVIVTVTDDDKGIGFGETLVTVNNVAPKVNAGNDQTITAGEFTTFSGNFSDPGWLDVHAAAWEFGDENLGAEKVSGMIDLTEENDPPDATGNVKGGKSFFKSGNFKVSLKVEDDDGGESLGTINMTVVPIIAKINVNPNVLNKKENDNGWITVHIGLPDGYDVNKIDIKSLKLNGKVLAETDPKYGFVKSEESIADYDEDGKPERMVKFSRSSVQEILEIGDSVTITVTGGVEYNNGKDTGLAGFQGQDIIRVVDKGNQKGMGKPDLTAPARELTFAAPPAYPQPCNPEVWIPYTLGKDVEVNILIYNVSGQLVQALNLGCQNAGYYTDKNKAAYWDGRNTAGEYVTSGVYFYTIKAGSYSAIRKLIIAK